MDLLWFYVAIALAVSDMLHTLIMWKIADNFYILLGGLISEMVNTPLQTWLVHEILEAVFHFIIMSLVFLNLKIGLFAALIHLVIDVGHNLLIKKHINEIEHRALHFVIESIFFIIITIIV
ncbi:MAG: hypothetical protein MJ209_06875 [archaeon]|nr:hypothetical protein [archaeon]